MKRIWHVVTPYETYTHLNEQDHEEFVKGCDILSEHGTIVAMSEISDEDYEKLSKADEETASVDDHQLLCPTALEIVVWFKNGRAETAENALKLVDHVQACNFCMSLLAKLHAQEAARAEAPPPETP